MVERLLTRRPGRPRPQRAGARPGRLPAARGRGAARGAHAHPAGRARRYRERHRAGPQRLGAGDAERVLQQLVDAGWLRLPEDVSADDAVTSRPEEPTQITVPMLLPTEPRPFSFGKVTRARLSGWAQRVVGDRKLRKRKAGAATRLLAVYTAAHSRPDGRLGGAEDDGLGLDAVTSVLRPATRGRHRARRVAGRRRLAPRRPTPPGEAAGPARRAGTAAERAAVTASHQLDRWGGRTAHRSMTPRYWSRTSRRPTPSPTVGCRGATRSRGWPMTAMGASWWR
ncbi:hypothetical protein LV779_22885 [Streptomyces thinghirensis]|nr:hypothetical protein [Streptomyces thinghirensis]